MKWPTIMFLDLKTCLVIIGVLFYHSTTATTSTIKATAFVVQSPPTLFKVNQHQNLRYSQNTHTHTHTHTHNKHQINPFRKRTSPLNYQSSSSSSSSSSSYKVLFQKVIRPPKQLLKDGKDNNLLFFLPSLIHYLQSTYTLPDNLPMTYDILVPSDDNNSGEEGSNDNESYTILELKSPLAPKDYHRFHLYIEVIGLYTGSGTSADSSTDAADDKGIPTMAMVVIKSKQSNSNDQYHQNQNDIIRGRLFQDSIDKIITSLDVGLDSFTFGDVPLMEITSTTNANNNDESWVGLDLEEYEGLDTTDSWNDLEQVLSSSTSSRNDGRRDGTMSWDKDVVIDTVATDTNDGNDDDNNNSDGDNHNQNKDHVGSVAVPKKHTMSTSTTDQTTTKPVATVTTISTDFAVQAAREAMEKKKHDMKKKKNKDKNIVGDNSNSNTSNSDGVSDYAVEMAKKAAKMKKKNENKPPVYGDYAVDSAQKIAQSTQKHVAPTSSSPSSLSSKTAKTATELDNTILTNNAKPKSNNPTVVDSQVSLGENMNLEDVLPQISPMVKKGMGHHLYTKSDAFRVSISDPAKFAESKIKRKNKRKGKKVEKKVKQVENTQQNDNDGNHGGNDDNNETRQNLKGNKELNVVIDETSLNPTEVSDEERQKAMNNLLFKTPTQTSSESSATELSQESISPEKTTKTQKEIEQDIYQAALNIMPGNKDDIYGESKEKDNITAEDLLRDVLKFGEEMKAEEATGAGFVDGAFNKAKELVSLEQNQQPQKTQLDYGYDSKKSHPSSEAEELKRIFAAGQDMAEGRISMSISSKQNMQVTARENDKVTDEYVDDLIDADKTVPRNARSLDDELAELELRISRTPGEDLDQGDNAIFDIFSGPEVFNPNVDPEGAVNWPGALPGTRTDIRLPPELEIAMKNARYAAQILSKVVEEDVDLNMQNDDDKKQQRFFIDGKEIGRDQIKKLQRCVEEGIAVGLIEDPFDYLRDKSRLDMVINELIQQPDERFGEIIVNYKDLLLSDNFVILLREKLRSMAKLKKECGNEEGTAYVKNVEEWQSKEQEIMEKMVQYAQLLLKEARALGAELESSQLEIIRSICKVAMDPSHETEEETAIALTDAVREMKPLLDENFVAYLKYAIAEEEGRLARAGLLDDPDENRWLYVLKIVQEGVYSELSKGVQRYIDHISYVLRMDTKMERRMLVSKFIDVMPSMDVRPFVKVVDNIAASLGAETRGNFNEAALGSMTNKILQLRRDVHDLLPSERIKALSKDADDWAARQKEKLLKQQGISQQRLKAARESQEYDEVIQRGEVERFD